MEPSIPGLIVCAVIILIGAFLRAPIILGLPIALAFGATSIGAVKALGGSTPLISVVFVLVLLGLAAIRRSLLSECATLFREHPIAWVAVALGLYSFSSAIILPRLFASQTTAFVPVSGYVVEVPLEPVSGNITQTGYLILGILTYLILSIRLRSDVLLRRAGQGLFAFVIAEASLGVADALGKMSGAGDLLKPIRSASYAMLTEAEEAGFARLVGGYSEASAFGAACLACIAFCYVYWRRTGSRRALALGVLMLLLTLLSTSSTSYVGLAALGVPVLISFVRAVLTDRLTKEDLAIAVAGIFGAMAVVGIMLHDDHALDSVFKLVDSTLLNKANSGSGQERTYWNMRSLASFVDTYGLGVGFGSSRASSWVVAVLSQLGVVGTALMMTLVGHLTFADLRVDPRSPLAKTAATAAAARAAALTYLLAQSISGGSADPGLLFFYALAVVGATRLRLEAQPDRSASPVAQLQVLTGRASL